ncbi:hypothetical protein TSMEX_011330 [Taenia solium]|eukprot:TsM_000137900 transcript=TsM_000137900 gene=TsM_000137900
MQKDVSSGSLDDARDDTVIKVAILTKANVRWTLGSTILVLGKRSQIELDMDCCIATLCPSGKMFLNIP